MHRRFADLADLFADQFDAVAPPRAVEADGHDSVAGVSVDFSSYLRPVPPVAGASSLDFFALMRPVLPISGLSFASAVIDIADHLRPELPVAGLARLAPAFDADLRPGLGVEGRAPADEVTIKAVSGDPLSAIDWGSKVQSGVVDVYFAPAGTFIDGVSDFGPAQGWTSWEQQQVLSVLARVADVTNLQFRVSPSTQGAEFRLGTFDLDAFDAIAFMVPPGEPYAGFMAFDPDWLRAIDADSNATLLSEGGFMRAVLLEEMLHGLGMAHAHDEGGTSTILEGVTAPVGSFGIGGLNQGVFTAMNYNEGWPGGPYGGAYQDGGYILVNDFGYETTPMALDVAVLQAKYGVATDFAVGDDTYRLPDANALGTPFVCIWDAAGKDTLRYDGARGAVLDLRAATLAGEVGGGGWVSYANGIRGGFTIAHGVVIENAVGGTGSDRITGNASANSLAGGTGNDTLNGGANADRLDGGAGSDSLIGGAGNDTYVIDAPGDRISETTTLATETDSVSSAITWTLGSYLENLTLGGSTAINGTGNSLANALNGNSGANVLNGGSGNDTISSGDGNDLLDGGSGNDSLTGGLGNDSYVVDASGDKVVEASGGGTDRVSSSITHTLAGYVESLTLTGQAGS